VSARRLLAFGVDALVLAVWAGVVAAVGVPLHLAGVTGRMPPLALNAVGALLVVAPGVLGLAVAESRPAGTTPGKRALGLVVRAADGSRLPFGRAAARNALKVGLPWVIAHAAVIAVTAQDPAPSAVLVAAYVVPAVWVAALFRGAGRTPYDRVAGSSVCRRVVRT
jgi:uncharacterized RDD family membrane protein YckC